MVINISKEGAEDVDAAVVGSGSESSQVQGLGRGQRAARRFGTSRRIGQGQGGPSSTGQSGQSEAAGSMCPARPPIDTVPLIRDESIKSTGSKAKSDLLKELMGNPGTYDLFDYGWRLVFHLMLVEAGVIVGSYNKIAERLGNVSGSTVKRWVKKLTSVGVIEHQQQGTRIEVRLIGDYAKIATAPNVITPAVPSIENDAPDISAVKKIADGAKALGGHVVITIEGCEIGRAP